MGIRYYKPTSPGRRNASVSDFSELTDKNKKPEKSLTEPITLVSGVTSVLLSLFQKVTEMSGKSTVAEVWLASMSLTTAAPMAAAPPGAAAALPARPLITEVSVAMTVTGPFDVTLAPPSMEGSTGCSMILAEADPATPELSVATTTPARRSKCCFDRRR